MLPSSYNIRIFMIFGFFLTAFTALGGWLYHIQIERHEELFSSAQKMYTETRKISGKRGEILDAHLNRLATTEYCKDIFIEPRRMPKTDRERVLKQLSKILEVPYDILKRRTESGKYEVVAKRAVSMKQNGFVEKMSLPGVISRDSFVRKYPKHFMLANILGFTNADLDGIAGLEQTMNVHLKAKEGFVERKRTRRGQTLFDREIDNELQSLHGNSIVLTIQEPIQFIVEKELRRLVDEHKPKYAFAILVNPTTGAIWAMAQSPSFDPNDRSQMDPDSYRNHAIEDVYHPGSTMKAISITGALQAGIVTLQGPEIYCENGLWFYAGRPLRDSHGYKWLSPLEIIQFSSNIGTAKMIMMGNFNKQRLYATFRRFGFGERTGIELNHESKGLLPPVRHWDKLSITRFPIGQGIAVTPLQMVQSYAALANNGKMMQLHLVDRVLAPSGKIVKEFEPKLKRMACTKKAASDMLIALEKVVTDGTGKRAKVKGYSVGGKTGTSQKLVNGTYEGHGKYVASFVGIAPIINPEFVLLVVADEPTGKSYYGGTVCGPTYSRISDQVLRYLDIKSTLAVNQ
ncbi:MAG: penicillin-binding protein 2 [Lentisphaeria bacterium]|nr:penicillin-binding protein 2 [Lentisphaeria bacterium]NQZ68459.1 penicillin-binding protein 2 [Lentisphaeria bacterium]